MTCRSPVSAPAHSGNRKITHKTALRLGVAAGLALAALSSERVSAADWPDDTFLRGSVSSKSAVRWDGLFFGGQIGQSSMNTDFGNSAGAQVAYVLRNTTLQSEFAPSGWTTLPATTTNSKTFGGFMGYNWQSYDLVYGFDAAYNRMNSAEAMASDTIARTVTLSDGTVDGVTINAQSQSKLIDYMTLRARAGYAFGQFLPYVVVGGAVGRFNYSTTSTVTVAQTPVGGPTTTFVLPTQTSGRNNAFSAGFVVGAGLDIAVLPNVFFRAEWEFVGFAPLAGMKSTLNTGRVGVGVRF